MNRSFSRDKGEKSVHCEKEKEHLLHLSSNRLFPKNLLKKGGGESFSVDVPLSGRNGRARAGHKEGGTVANTQAPYRVRGGRRWTRGRLNGSGCVPGGVHDHVGKASRVQMELCV